MVFSDTSNKNGAIQLCEFYCQQGDGGISGNITLFKQFTNLINIAGSEVWHLIFQLNGGWKYDDSNYTDLPQATQNLTAGTQKYALPMTALTVARIEVLDANGVYHKLQPIRMEEIDVSISSFYSNQSQNGQTSTGLPAYYRLIGSTIELFPNPAASAITATAGLKVYFDRASVGFASSDTTKTFGFASEYHDIPPRKASIEWLKVNKPDSKTLDILIQDDVAREGDLQDYEAFKWKDNVPHGLTARGRRFVWR